MGKLLRLTETEGEVPLASRMKMVTDSCAGSQLLMNRKKLGHQDRACVGAESAGVEWRGRCVAERLQKAM